MKRCIQQGKQNNEMSTIISTKELLTATGFTRVSDLEKCLRSQNVPFLFGKKGSIFTTIDAFNNALGVGSFIKETTGLENCEFES